MTAACESNVTVFHTLVSYVTISKEKKYYNYTEWHSCSWLVVTLITFTIIIPSNLTAVNHNYR